MRISRLTMKNFKTFGEDGVHIDFAPITLLFGKNSSGKSTIIQALHLAYTFFCSDNPDFDRIPLFSLGNFPQYVHNHDIDRKITIGLEIELNMNVNSIEDIPDDLPYIPRVKIENLTLRYIGIEFDLGWNFESINSEIQGMRIYIDRNIIAELKSGDIYYRLLESADNNNDYCYGALDGKLYENEEIIDHKLEEEIFIHKIDGKEFIRTDSHSEWPIHENGAPVLDIDMMDKLEFMGYPSDLDTIKQLIKPCKAFQDILKELITIGPAREMPSRAIDTPHEISWERWFSGIAAWEHLLQISDKKRKCVNDALGQQGIKSNYSIIVEEVSLLPSNSKLAEMVMYDDNPLSRITKKLHEKSGSGKVDDTELEEFLIKHKEDIWQLFDSFSNTQKFARSNQYSVLRIKNDKGIILHPADLGYGISQLIPVLTALVATDARCVAIEQPELHIHPAWQQGIGDVLIDNMNASKIFLIETHSEHLILRLMRRIRETYEYKELIKQEKMENSPTTIYNNDKKPQHMINHDYLKVYWIGDSNGSTEIQLIDINEEGCFTVLWPEGFFDERMEDLS